MAFTSGNIDNEVYDVKLNGRGFMLADGGDGKLLWQQTKIKFAPGGPSPEAEPYTVEPTLELPQVFSSWRNGVGWREQPDISAQDSNGIFYGRYIDKHGIYLGPSAAVTAFQPATPDTVNGGNQFIEFIVNGTATLLCASGRYLHYRVNDTSWLVAKDFGAGNKITGMAIFRGSQAGAFLFIAYQNSSGVAQIYQVWDGATVTTTFTPDTNSTKAVDFVQYRDELWLLNQDANGRWQVQKCIDGGTGAAWGGGFVIADGGRVTCKHMVIAQDRLFIRSTQGIIAVNAQENDAQQVTGDAYRLQYQTLNECRPVSFGQFAITQIASSFTAYDPSSGDLQEIGMGNLKNNDSSIATGVHTCAAPYRLWTMYTWTYNAINSTAYLWRWSDHELFENSYQPVPVPIQTPCLYGSLYEQAAQVNGMIVSEIGGTTPRLYWVDTTDTISFMPLSAYGASPNTDNRVTYNTTNNSEIYFPAVTSRNAVEVKSNAGVAVAGRNFSGTNFWTMSYRTDPAVAFGGSADLENGAKFTSTTGQRNNWTVASTCRWLEIKLVCTNSSTTVPPLIKAVVTYQIMRPVFKWLYQATFKLSDRLHTRSGSDRGRLFSVSDDRTFLESLASTSGLVNMTTPDNATVQVLVTNLTMEITRREPNERPEFVCTVEMAEHRPVAVNGQYIRVAGFGTFTYAYLATLSYGQMALL